MTDALVLSTKSKHHLLRVYYEPEHHRFRLNLYPLDDLESCVASSYCEATYEPVFGIDVADMATIFKLAEVTEDDVLFFKARQAEQPGD
jgi:hypothetical protein